MPGIILHLSADDLEQLFDRKLKEVLDEVLDEALQPIHSKLDAIEEKLEKLTARVEVVEGLAAKIPNMEDDLRSQD
ncbi:hypothetical protein FocTR4_00003050 [Fusarium oxysporum f. sp. cubense]|nr:hypothetical protein FocTR4_00003050 [Fusarium oxysporum f. sp. cubense]